MAQVEIRAPRRSSGRLSGSARATSDSRLARRASNGDRQAVAAIFERYQQELYGFCLGLLGEPQDAQDALQNTMVKVLRALPGEQREIALRPWLYRVARNEAIELRRHRRPTQALEGHLVDGRASVIERAEQREHLHWLLKDLGDLPDRQRTVLVMRELSGLDFAEIAAALGTSGAVVRQALYEARRNLEQMDHGRNLGCEAVAKVLSDADRRITRRRDIRAHLRDCPECRRFRDAIGRRERVLSTIPPISVPAGAAAGIGQALFGGSGSGGAVAALTGAAMKSAGTYGALKVAGTLAAVAVIGTAAIEAEIEGPAREAPPRHAHAEAEGKSSRLPSARQAKVVAARAPAGPSYRLAATAESVMSPTAVRVSDRRPRFVFVRGEGSSFEAVARPADFSHPAAPVAHPLAGDHAAGPAPGETDRSSETEKNPAHAGASEPSAKAEPTAKTEPSEKTEQGGKAKAGPAQAPKPEKGPGSAVRPEQGKPEHPGRPAGPNQAQAPTAAAGPPPRSEPNSEPGPAPPKAPPGQTQKQASAEAQPPSSAPPPPPETAPAPAGAEPPQPVPNPAANGHAKVPSR